jgi:hypothetical protein
MIRSEDELKNLVKKVAVADIDHVISASELHEIGTTSS